MPEYVTEFDHAVSAAWAVRDRLEYQLRRFSHDPADEARLRAELDAARAAEAEARAVREREHAEHDRRHADARARACATLRSWGGGSGASIALDGGPEIWLIAGSDAWYEFDRSDWCRYGRVVGTGARCTEATRRLTPEGVEALRAIQRAELARIDAIAAEDAEAWVAAYAAHAGEGGWCSGRSMPEQSWAGNGSVSDLDRDRAYYALLGRGHVVLWEASKWRLAAPREATFALLAGYWAAAWRALAREATSPKPWEEVAAWRAALGALADALRPVADPDAQLRRWVA